MTQEASTPTGSLGARIRDARGTATQEDVIHRVRDLLPAGRRPGASVLSRIENGIIKHPEPYVVAAIATACGKTLEELAPEYVEEAEAIASVLQMAHGTREQVSRRHTWIPDSPDWSGEYREQERRAS